ncbi:hypothetical protein BH11BAC1_BH11BAC1_16490 [soil metagenome]
MNKLNQMRLLGLASLRTQQLTPITYGKDTIMYATLLNKFEKFEKWRDTKKITRHKFESHLNKSEELVNAYLEVFSKTAGFYKCIVVFGEVRFDYYVMMRYGKIVLFFYCLNQT